MTDGTVPERNFILTLSCPNTIGIVHAVAHFLLDQRCNITDSAQFDDESTGRFFMRVAFAATDRPVTRDSLAAGFADVAAAFTMDWALYDQAVRPRVLVLVSKFDHCLADLLYRRGIGEMAMDIPMVISNHPDSAPLVEAQGIPYRHLPVTRDTKAEQEAQLLDLIRDARADLVVLARYMQILSDGLCVALPCPAINIHHSFLPSFKGARPYHQAHTRGVKLIGATAHYVTPDLDEGPIIEQAAERVSHALTPDDLIAVGRDIERRVLSRAVRLHLERRVLLNDGKTVVFS